MKSLQSFINESYITEAKKMNNFKKDDVEVGDVLIDTYGNAYIYLSQDDIKNLVDTSNDILGAEYYEDGVFFKPGMSSIEKYSIINPGLFDNNWKTTKSALSSYGYGENDFSGETLYKGVVDVDKLNDFDDLVKVYKMKVMKLK